jgi:hypothetical protein
MSIANHRCAFRPLRGGTLIFQPDSMEAGTLGIVLTSDGVDRWLLTCHHVLARKDHTFVATDSVLQPDAGAGAIASMAAAVGDALLDCVAVPVLLPSSDEVMGIGRPAPVKPPAVGMRVVKSGWKTGISEGRIRQVNGTEVVIELLPGFPADYLLAGAGDSGAVWFESGTLAPIALHKRESAVGPHLAFATEFGAVLGAVGLHQL